MLLLEKAQMLDISILSADKYLNSLTNQRLFKFNRRNRAQNWWCKSYYF